MSWLFEVKRYSSPNNGAIVCQRFFGQWNVFVDGYYQSSPYIKQMWRQALRRVPSNSDVHRILLLGLGAGSIIDDLHSQFPEASITAVDYDPVMAEIGRELKMFEPSVPEIIIGDATDVVPKLEGEFDLIVIDLYRGKKTAPILEEADFLGTLAKKLSPTGTLLLNVFENTSLLSKFDQHLTRQETWKYRYNTLASYKTSSI